MNARAKLSRRNFLLVAGAGGAAAVIASKANRSVVKAQSSGADKRRGEGYRETVHVRNYYRTAKV